MSIAARGSVLLALLTACAGPRQAAGRPGPPLASAPDVEHAEGLFEGAGDVSLFEESWRPRGHVRAALVIVHGLKDYGDHYAAVGEALARRGYAVHTFDLRGHGHSSGERVWVTSFKDYLSDLDVFVARVRRQEVDKPLFLFGHSMGGAIAALYTITRQPQLQGLILSGPALKPGAEVSGFLIAVTKTLGTVAPHLGLLSLDNRSFSRDPKVVLGMDHDPWIYNHPGPARTAAELLRAMAQIQARMGEITVPLLAMHGTADKLTNPEGSRELVQRAASKDKTLKLYDGFYHDLLHEPDKDRAQVQADVIAWLELHATPAGAATPPGAPR